MVGLSMRSPALASRSRMRGSRTVHRTNAGHDLALRQMPVAHDTPAACLGLEIHMSAQEVSDLRLNGLLQQGMCPAAQNLGE